MKESRLLVLNNCMVFVEHVKKKVKQEKNILRQKKIDAIILIVLVTVVIF